MNIKTALLLVIAATMALGVAACGGDGSTASGEVAGNGTDRAFGAEMIPHHRSAVEMAEIAKKRGDHPEIKQLADAIISTQNAEIAEMKRFDQPLKDAGLKPADLGMTAQAMGTDMDAAMLQGAKPFDREFIDMMIGHHQGAIRMARVELEKGKSPGLLRLAKAIVDAQSKEIDQMNQWRVDWFGSLSPASGVPTKDDGGHSGHGM